MEPISAVAASIALLVAKSSAETLGGEVGRGAWSGLARIRGLLASHFKGDAAAEKALVAAQQQPDDDQAVNLLREVITYHMLRDQAFASELSRLSARASGPVGHATTINAEVVKQHVDGDVTVHGDFTIN